MEDSNKSFSRRQFGTAVGVVAAVTASGTVFAQNEMSHMSGAPKAMGGAGGRKVALSKLSNKLFSSPDARQAFLSDPNGYATKFGGASVSTADIANLKQMFADGFCCGGCGCGSATERELEAQ
jgi:hypothetical protein